MFLLSIHRHNRICICDYVEMQMMSLPRTLHLSLSHDVSAPVRSSPLIVGSGISKWLQQSASKLFPKSIRFICMNAMRKTTATEMTKSRYVCDEMKCWMEKNPKQREVERGRRGRAVLAVLDMGYHVRVWRIGQEQWQWQTTTVTYLSIICTIIMLYAPPFQQTLIVHYQSRPHIIHLACRAPHFPCGFFPFLSSANRWIYSKHISSTDQPIPYFLVMVPRTFREREWEK